MLLRHEQNVCQPPALFSIRTNPMTDIDKTEVPKGADFGSYVEEQKDAAFQKYVEKLKEINRIKDDPDNALVAPILIDYQVNKLVDAFRSIFGFDKRSIHQHLALIQKPVKLDAQTTYTLSQLKSDTAESLEWIVPPLIPPGDLIILFGKAKSKKSLLAVYELAYAVSHGGTFLGFPCKQGKVLIFETEESATSVKRRLKGRGFFDNGSADVRETDQVKIYRDFDLMTDLPRLKQFIDQEKPALIIFDSLRKSMANSRIAESSPDFATPVYQLQSLLIKEGVAGVMVHHANKTTATQSGVDSMSGSSALQGACGAMWQLKDYSDTDKSDTRSILNITPRDGHNCSFVIRHSNTKSRRWMFKMEEEIGVEPEVLEMDNKILKFLSKNSPQAYTYDGIADHILPDL